MAEGQQYPGGRPVALWGIYILIGYILLMAVLTFTTLVVLWPPVRPEGKAEAQKLLDGGATTVATNQSADAATQAPAAPVTPQGQGAAPAQNTAPAQGAAASGQPAAPGQNAPPASGTPAQGAAATQGGAATPTPTPRHPELLAVIKERDEHRRIFNGYCVDMYGRLREGVAPLKVPFVSRLGIPVASPRCVYDEDRLLLIVLFAGALGGLAHALRSLAWYIGNRRLVWSWSALYFLTPFTSAAIALIFYFVIRGGFFSPSSSVSDTNPAFFAALGALIGMFTEEAINKLRSVAETVLTPKEQGKDHVGAAPVVTSITPASGPTAGGTEVSVVGDNFQPGVAVAFGGGVAKVKSVEAKLIKVDTPAHAAGKVDVVVTNTDRQSHVSAKAFEYTDGAPADGKPPDKPGQPQPPEPPVDPEKPKVPPVVEAAPPTISAIQPPTGRKAGGERLTIRGANFAAGAFVTIDGQDATEVTVQDANTITLLTPAVNTEGSVEVVVTNPDGGSTSPAVFTYTP